MTGKQKIAVAASAVLSVGIVVTGLFFIIRYKRPNIPISLTGVVLVQDKDPQKQAPIAFANLTASSGAATVRAKTDVSGQFLLTLPGGQEETPPPVTLKVEAESYEPRELTVENPNEIQVLYLRSTANITAAALGKPLSTLANVRVRYSEKATSVSNIGSVAKTFEVVNTGNVPCKTAPVCSPDGKWRATIGSITLEGQGNEFRNIRLSCIAGPCPFTRRESELPPTALNLNISVRNWSDTATFLLEAEVSQTRTIDVVRESYPAHFGAHMTFTLPPTAEGPSIEAEMNGDSIVYPLGPDLLLSWGVCTMKMAPNRTRTFRCDLKPGYQFK